MSQLKALIFNVNGTLADTDQWHLRAYNQAFADLGLDWHWDETLYAELLEFPGGNQRILHYWRTVNPDMKAIDSLALADTVAQIHDLKLAHYEATFTSGAVELRPGVLALIEEAMTRGLMLAIVTTTSPVNLSALMGKAMGPGWQYNFAAFSDAANGPKRVPKEKLYQQLLDKLKLEPRFCLAFEDSAHGLKAARLAGLPTLITPTRNTLKQDFSGAIRVVPDLEKLRLSQILQWHQEFSADPV